MIPQADNFATAQDYYAALDAYDARIQAETEQAWTEYYV